MAMPHRGPEQPRMYRNLRVKCESNVEKLDSRFLKNKTKTFFISVANLILRFSIVQNKFQQKIKLKQTISMTIASSSRFLYILVGFGLLCAGRARGDDHLLSTVAETRHELVSVSFLHIYKASNVCVPL